MTKIYTAVSNIPGYLPDTPAESFTTYEDARLHLMAVAVHADERVDHEDAFPAWDAFMARVTESHDVHPTAWGTDPEGYVYDIITEVI